ncbi:hypothetical protein CHELA20_50554 [Hyphomicrobiales bacterium]|nr:hypothetical protein CHELA20_50554 [Hyphomicrobiales bacterium]CAH1678693.1 hypothetical protein CHELA41_24573 [Hyphomicrobiales bacterium]
MLYQSPLNVYRVFRTYQSDRRDIRPGSGACRHARAARARLAFRGDGCRSCRAGPDPCHRGGCRRRGGERLATSCCLCLA